MSQYDQYSTGPAPATSVLIMNLAPATSNQAIRNHFATFGHIVSYEAPVDKSTGGYFGIVLITYRTHEQAKAVVAKENGRMFGQGTVMGVPNTEKEPMRVVLDANGQKMRAVLRELAERKKREEVEKRRRHAGPNKHAAGSTNGTPAGAATPAGATPRAQAAPAVMRRPAHASLPQRPAFAAPLGRPGEGIPAPIHGTSATPAAGFIAPSASSTSTPSRSLPPGLPAKPTVALGSNAEPSKRPPSSLTKARVDSYIPGERESRDERHRSRERERDRDRYQDRERERDRSPVYARGRGQYSARSYRSRYDYDRRERSWSHGRSRSRSRTRSPSPITRRPVGRSGRDRDRDAVQEELARNGWDHVRITGGASLMSGMVREEDVRAFVAGFDVEKVRVCALIFDQSDLPEPG